MYRFVYDQEGGIAENTAIIVLILTIAVGAMTYLAPKIKGVFTAIGSKL